MMHTLVLRLFVLLFLGGSILRTGAASLGVSPAAMHWAQAGPITLTIAGLPSNGETVRLERFVDANGNGGVDAGELLVLSFLVTDGEVTMFGGERDANIPGDEDGAANGQIVVALTPAQLPEFNRAVGSYLFRVSSPDAAFAPLVQPFVVTQAPFGQAVRGIVTVGGSPLAGAAVAFLDGANDGHFLGGVFTDGAGAFSFNAPPGDYLLAAIKNGYVMDLADAPEVSVSSGLDVTQNVAALSADRTISGRVFDAASSNGLGGFQLFVAAFDQLITLAHTDAEGNFSIGVLGAPWLLELSEEALAVSGYTGGDFVVDASSGSVSNVNIALTRGRGEFGLAFFFPGGSFGNGTNGLITFPTHLNYYFGLYSVQDVNLPTNVFFTGPIGSGLSNSPSVYGGSGGHGSAFYSSMQVDTPPYPPSGIYTVNYKGENLDFLLQNLDVQNRQIVLVPTATVSSDNVLERINWTVRDVNGNFASMPSSITGIEIRVDGMSSQLYSGEVPANATEHTITDYVTWTNVNSIQMVYDDIAGNQYVAFWHRGVQPLQIITTTNLPPAQLRAPYQHGFVVTGGLPPHTWSLPPSATLPPGLSFSETGELSGEPGLEGTFTFAVRVTDADEQSIDKMVTLVVLAALRAEPVLPLTPGQFRLRVAGQAGQNYTLQYSTTLTGWTDVVTATAPADSFELVDLGATDNFRFYRVRHNP